MNTEAIETVSDSVADRRVRVRTEIRTLAAEQVASRSVYNAIKRRYHTDPEFRADQDVHDKVKRSRGEYDHPLSRYDLTLASIRNVRSGRSARLRALALSTTFLRGRAYRVCEPTSVLYTLAMKSTERCNYLRYDDEAVIRAVAEIASTTPEVIMAWVKVQP